MLFATIAILAAGLELAHAIPALKPRQFEAQLQFLGAAGTEYTISAPTSGSTPFTTGQSLAVDGIVLEGGATCTLFGVDGGSFTVVGANSVVVAPPQAITGGSCLAL